MKSCFNIGVTGHRDIVESEALKKELETFFNALLLEHKQVRLYSALADGADRLVAKIFLEFQKNYNGLELIVPMPFSQTRYLQDFSYLSQQEFLNYLKVAEDVFSVEEGKGTAYEKLGKYVVNHTDLLLALWDGTFNHKAGGTGEVVAYAKVEEHKVLHFHCERKGV